MNPLTLLLRIGGYTCWVTPLCDRYGHHMSLLCTVRIQLFLKSNHCINEILLQIMTLKGRQKNGLVSRYSSVSYLMFLNIIILFLHRYCSVISNIHTELFILTEAVFLLKVSFENRYPQRSVVYMDSPFRLVWPLWSERSYLSHGWSWSRRKVYLRLVKSEHVFI